MLVTCPNCKSVFKLPDTQKIDQKLRCSICKNVFVIQDTHYEYEQQGSNAQANNSHGPSFGSSRIDLDTPFANDKGVKPKSLKARIFSILFFASICVTAILWSFTPYLDPIKEKFNLKSNNIQSKLDAENKRIEELAKKVKLLQIQSLRQYTMPNDKIGNLTIIEGKVVNGFDEPRGFIQVDCSLYDETGELLINKKQIAGTSLSLFQLQVLNEEELEQNLNNNLDILEHNTNISPGGSTPFMCVFYNPPDDAANFNIKIVSADIPGQNQPK